ncbi:MAG: PaaI family thioesterase [Chloroflexota bacterium]|nr:PaaI family thioesterase [Chloroflexota bacterium]
MYDDEWYEQWKQRMEESGNIILALGLRPIAEDDDRVVMEMPMSRNVRQGTGVFAAGALMQLADVAATIVCQRASGSTAENPKPFPLSVQISMNLLRNTNRGKATAESRMVHRGRTMTVVESKVHDDDGRLLCIVTSTHIAPGG